MPNEYTAKQEFPDKDSQVAYKLRVYNSQTIAHTFY